MDTGFGNSLNAIRTVRALERAGAAGLQIEDQIFPKRCGHFSGKEVVPVDEIVQKIQAAVDTRIDPNLQIIARTDSRAVLGLDAAIERGQKFVEAGADVIFIEAPLNEDELRRVAKEITAPQLVNIVFGGLTPALSQAKFKEMGFSIVLYANAALQAALKAANEVLGALKSEGSLDSVRDRLASFEERQRVVEKAQVRQARNALHQRIEGGQKMTKPWDGIISEDEQRAYRAAGFGRPTGLGTNPGTPHHRRAVSHDGNGLAAVLGIDQGISDVLR